MHADFQNDIENIARIAAVPTILNVICKTTGMGFAAIARVTDGRWIACQVLDNIDFGLKPGGELKVETTICHLVRKNRQPVIINNVDEDAIYSKHPTPKMYGFQSYISMPIVLPDGSFFGTLCAIDPRPARVNSVEVIGMFKLFAELIAFHFDASDKMIRFEKKLLDERQMAELREQFIAVLGHDLRNPLASINAGANQLLRLTPDTKAAGIVKLMQGSVKRMSGLIDNVLDFTRGRLGGGLALERESKSLEPTLRQVIDEISLVWHDRKVTTKFQLSRPFFGDHARVAQLFSNLLGNAVTHGDDTPVRVEAYNDDKEFRLDVVNNGNPIPHADLKRLFQPFYRGPCGANLQGLGLGLFIASEIARAHGGDLRATSTITETRFTLLIPAQPA
nr:D428 [uncultured bacterium]